MKKSKIYSIIITCAVCCAAGITACVPKGLGEHNWSQNWSSNSKAHWHRCLDAGCNGKEEYGEHEWELTLVYKEPTCGDTGLGQYTCATCKATMGNAVTPATIPATGKHDYKLYEVDYEPTCGDVGFGSYICNVCYNYALMPISATGEHDYSGKYEITEEGHYHVCRNGCGHDEEIQPHVKGKGVRHEPVGTKDGFIEYRCTVCDYLIDWEAIPNPNILSRFDVKFVKANNSSIVAIPTLGEDGELYVSLAVSSNAVGGYKLEITGYTAQGDTVSDTGDLTLYHYDEYTGKKTQLTFENMGMQSVGYMGYLTKCFYISRATEDVSLWLECTQGSRAPVSLKVHIKTV